MDVLGSAGASASGTLLTGCSGDNCQITEPAEVRLDSPQSCPDGATIYSRETIAANHIGNPNSIAIGCDGTAGGGGG